MAREFPMLGIGWGAFSNTFGLFRVSGPGVSVEHAENDYLQLLAEYGVLGCVLVLVAVFIVVRSVLHKNVIRPDFGFLGYGAAAGVIALAFHSLTDSILGIPSIALTVAALMGLIVSWWRVPTPASANPPMEGPGRNISTTIATATLTVAAGIALAPVVPYPSGISPRTVEGASPRHGFSSSILQADFGMHVDGDNPERLIRMAAMVGGGAVADMEALVKANPKGPFHEMTIDYITKRLRKAEVIVARSLRQLPSMANAHIAMAELRINQCISSALLGRAQSNCILVAMPALWAALEVNPMGAITHARVAKVLIRAWPFLDEKTRAHATEVITQAVILNPGDRLLMDAAESIKI
jgi:hypothetical protein